MEERKSTFKLPGWFLVFGLFCVVQVTTCPTRDAYLSNFDHGYQLGGGIQILRGKVPGVDVLVHYGPLVYYASALWYRLSGSLIGETLACAVGFAACLAIIYSLVTRHTKAVWGLLAACVCYWLEARYYKWYIWLFPLGTLWLLDSFAATAPARRIRGAALTGLWVGLGWLFRWDVGTLGGLACLAFFALIQTGKLLDRLRPPGRESVAFLLGFVFPLAAWSGYLLANRGWTGLFAYGTVTIRMSLELARSMALPLPPFSMADPLSPGSLLVIGYLFVPVTYLICGAWWLRAEAQDRRTRRTTLLLAIVLVGGSTFHQALHRKDGSHLLQVLPPATLGAMILVAELVAFRSRDGANAARPWAIQAMGVTYALLTLAIGLGLTPYGRTDLSPPANWSGGKLRELAHPLDSGKDSPVISALRLVREVTDRDDPILVFPFDSQYYAFVNRPASGRMTLYVPDVFSSPAAAQENLRAIRQAMPRVVLLSPLSTRPDSSVVGQLYGEIARSHSYLLEFITSHYTRRLFSSDQVVVLAPPEDLAIRPVTGETRAR
ncbi:MAG: hypothetical protein ACP5XB_28115 [Isosphaeraceae bacterium]